MLALGIICAIGASVLYNTSIALQAMEAREVPHEHSLRISLIGKLVRNRKWLGATALGLLGWPLEIVALLLAPLTVVQPCLVSGLIVLLWLGATRLGETPGKREFVAVAAIIAGVAGVAWAAPDRTTDHAGTAAVVLALGLVAIPILAPYALRERTRLFPHWGGVKVGSGTGIGLLAVLSAGFGYAWTAIASKLLTDELAAGTLLVAVAWLATALASEGLALLSEMSALQRRLLARQPAHEQLQRLRKDRRVADEVDPLRAGDVEPVAALIEMLVRNDAGVEIGEMIRWTRALHFQQPDPVANHAIRRVAHRLRRVLDEAHRLHELARVRLIGGNGLRLEQDSALGIGIRSRGFARLARQPLRDEFDAIVPARSRFLAVLPRAQRVSGARAGQQTRACATPLVGTLIALDDHERALAHFAPPDRPTLLAASFRRAHRLASCLSRYAA